MDVTKKQLCTSWSVETSTRTDKIDHKKETVLKANVAFIGWEAVTGEETGVTE